MAEVIIVHIVQKWRERERVILEKKIRFLEKVWSELISICENSGNIKPAGEGLNIWLPHLHMKELHRYLDVNEEMRARTGQSAGANAF